MLAEAPLSCYFSRLSAFSRKVTGKRGTSLTALAVYDRLHIPRLERVFTLRMSRSLKKGPYVDFKLLKKVANVKPASAGVIKTWARASQISPEFLGFTFGVHNGKQHVEVLVTEDMVGHRLGEFSPTKKFIRHGGKMQKQLEQKKQESEIAAAKAAKASPTAPKKK
jgi:small subunit ribosomal protein S19